MDDANTGAGQWRNGIPPTQRRFLLRCCRNILESRRLNMMMRHMTGRGDIVFRTRSSTGDIKFDVFLLHILKTFKKKYLVSRQ